MTGVSAPRVAFLICYLDNFLVSRKNTDVLNRHGRRNRSWRTRPIITHRTWTVPAGSGGNTLTVEEPLNNIVRVTLEVLASALAGVQAIHACSYDEAYAIPTEEAQLIALRTQQIVAYEAGMRHTIDPLASTTWNR
jgi:methylmalonyl-CoA mutase N-terminal domain/subunit